MTEMSDEPLFEMADPSAPAPGLIPEDPEQLLLKFEPLLPVLDIKPFDPSVSVVLDDETGELVEVVDSGYVPDEAATLPVIETPEFAPVDLMAPTGDTL